MGKSDEGVTYRDMSIPYTDKEIEALVNFFKTLPTYDPGNGGHVSVEQVPAILESMRMERNSEQVEIYKQYWNTYFGGRVFLKEYINIVRNVDKNDTFLVSLAQNCDKDKDGFISEDEFVDLMKLLIVHDPSLEKHGISFEEFVTQADTNRDGRVSVEECGDWLTKLTTTDSIPKP